MILLFNKAYSVKVVLTKEGRGQKSQKMDDVFYEWPHTLIILGDFSVFGFMTHSGSHSALLAPHLD